MKINQVDLHRNYLQNKANIDSALARCISNSAFINGDEVDGFEREFAEYTSAEECVGVSSGTSALHLSLLALGIGKGDEVIVPSLTFYATAEAVSQVGATPVFVDVDPTYYLFDLTKALKLITTKTKAIITVDLYGQTLNNKKVRNFCDGNNLFFIQDCAHSAGAKFNNEPVSLYADLACWSFYPGKNLDCMGDGGAVTGSKELINIIKRLKDHNRSDKYTHIGIGWSARLDGLHASVLREKLKLLTHENELRRSHAEFYNLKLSAISALILPRVNDHAYHVYHQYVLLIDKRDELLDYMNDNDITLGVHYPTPCHTQPAYNGICDVSSSIASSCVSLPVHPYLLNTERAHVVKKLLEFTART
jgi:dTDP-4-amino-4,6-dideoxygalactose transaminase